MSILLDALRKSEQHKRSGEVPGINSPGLEPASVVRDGFGTQVWILLGIALAALLWLAWKQYAPFEPQPDVAAATEREAGELSGGQPQAARDNADSLTGSRTPVETLAEADAKTADGSDTTAADSGKGAADSRTTAEDSAEKTALKAKKSAARRAAQTGTPGDSSGQNSGKAAGSGTTTNNQALPAPISYWELPQTIRDELPEFRISVLVYAEEPKDRFILMNGKRAGHSDVIMPGLNLTEVQRDRAVFTYRKYRFYVKQ